MPDAKRNISLTPRLATVPGSSDPTGDEWPMFHGALNHSGFAETTPVKASGPLWTYWTTYGVQSSPAIANGRLYFGDFDCLLYCLNAYTGAYNWSYLAGSYAFINTSPAVADGHVYVGSQNDKISCVNANTGVSNWSYPTGGTVSLSSPAVADGRVYEGCDNDKLCCLGAKNGSLIWSYPTNGMIPSSPAVANGRVYVGCYDQKLYCLNASNGTKIWSHPMSYIDSSPAIAGGYVYVGSEDKKIYCLNATTGTHVWNYTTGNYVESSPAVAGGYVYVGSRDGKLYCLNATTGKSMWNYTTGSIVDSSPAVSCGYVYFGSNDDKIYCVNATTGALAWSYTTGDYIDSSPAIAGGRVYIGSEDDAVYCFPMLLVPTSPRNLNIASGNGQLVLTWQAPSSTGGSTIKGYRIYRSTSSGAETLYATVNQVTTYTDTGVTNGQRYYYKVSAINGAGEGDLSSEASATPIATFTLSSDAGSPDADGKFTLSWTTAIGAINYTIYTHPTFISTINGSLTVVAPGLTGLSYFVQGLTNGTRYYIAVAFNAISNWSSNCIRITVQLVPPGPFSLTSDAGSPDADGKFMLSWTAASGGINYTIYTHPTFINAINNSLTIVASGLTNSSRFVQGLANGTYYYIATAFNAYGNRSSNCISVTVQIQPPGPFTISSDAGSPDDDGKFALTWTASNWAQNYNVYTCLSTITQINGSVASIATSITGLSCNMNGVTNGTHYYIVVAFNPSGNKTSNCIAVDVEIHWPGSFILTSTADNPDTDGQFALSWSISSNADNYSLYYSTRYITSINNTVHLVMGGLTNQSMFVSRVSSGMYYFIIVAINKNGNTTSNCIIVTVQLPTPGFFTLSSDAGNPDDDGKFTLSWTTSSGASNYSVYMFSHPITIINASSQLLAAGATNLSIFVSGLVNGTYYFIIVAFNNLGNASSNCLGMIVAIPPVPSTANPIVKFLEDYWIFIVAIAAGIVVISATSASRRKHAARVKASQRQVPATKAMPPLTIEPGIGLAIPQAATSVTIASGPASVQQPAALAAITAKFFCPSCMQYHDIVNPAMETWYSCPACGGVLQFVKICPHCNQSIALTREEYAYYKDKAIECWNCKNQVSLG